MRRRPFALALVLCSLAAPAAARAAAWLEPVGLSDASTAAPQVDTGLAGDTVAIWSVNSAVQARVRAPGGAFGEVQQLSGNGSSPDVGVAGDGTAVAVWAEGESIRHAIRAPGAAFAGAQALPGDGAAGTPSLLQVAMNEAGDTLVTYVRSNAPYAALRPAGGTFGAPVALAAGGCNPRPAIGAAGHGAVAWQTSCAASEIRVARRAPGAAFGAGTGLGEPGAAPAVTVEANGTTTVAYERAGAIRAAAAPAGGGFGAPATISTDAPTSEPALASGGGEVWAVWRSSAGAARVAGARRPAGGAFAPVADPSPESIAAGPPRLQGAESGAMLAAWHRQVGDSLHVEAAWREPGAPAFGTPALISGAGSAVLGDAGGDGDGNAALGYLLAGKPVTRVLDGAGPRLLNLDVRTAGFAKESYGFGFAPTDAWSTVTASAFDFGDGTAVPGPAATHAYPEPAGPRTITLTATDAAANTSRLQRPFQVAPAIDRTPPVISAVRLDAKRFRVSNKTTPAHIAATRRGTRFRYTLSEPAAVTITFERLAPGRRKGSRCVRGRTRGKRCRVSEPAGSIVRQHPVAGPVSVGFTGRVTANVGPLRVYDNTLLPGTYRVTFAAIDQLRNVSQPVKGSFRVVSR